MPRGSGGFTVYKPAHWAFAGTDLYYGDQGFGLLGLAITPSYAQIGPVSPVLLLVFRLIQGIGVGGEVGSTTAFLVEAAPPHRRGLYGSLQFGTQYFDARSSR